MFRSILYLFTGLIILTGCLDKTTQSSDSQALLLNDHPLASRIWDVKQSRFIPVKQLFTDLLNSEYVLLGESHDNIYHHKRQAQIISFLHKSRVEASVHFEMIDDEQYQSQKLDQIGSFAGLMKRLNATDSGWNYEQMYRPVFEQVVEAGYSIRSANLNLATVRKIAKEGEVSIPGLTRTLMDLAPLSVEQEASLKREVIEGHCHAMPEKMLAPMILAQRARDAVMTHSLLQSNKDKRVLIAGSGHVRNDRGVPHYLVAKASQAKILSLGFIEVIENSNHVEQYLDRWDGKSFPFDYVWFTPRRDRQDPCQELIKMMQHSVDKKAADQKLNIESANER